MGASDFDTQIENIAEHAARLGERLPRICDPLVARWTARALHILLLKCAKGHGALDIAIGEGLDAMSVGFRCVDIQYSNAWDYAREELGINASTAEKMARLARNLRRFPLIRDAVRRGDLSTRKAEIIVQVASAETESTWLCRAMESTVRALRAETKAPPDPDDEELLRLTATIPVEGRPVLDTALQLAGKVLERPTASTSERVEAMCQEYIAGHTVPADECADNAWFMPTDEADAAKKFLEEQHGNWADLPQAEPVRAPEESGEIDPWRIHAELLALVERRRRWHEVFGQLLLLFNSVRAWDVLGLHSMAHYTEEILGMGRRTVAQRAALERDLRRNPVLREALQQKRITYEKARILARAAGPEGLRYWIAKAQKMTCIALRRTLEKNQQEQMCAEGTFSFVMPASIAQLLKGTFRVIRDLKNRWMHVGEYLLEIAAHFILVYEYLLEAVRTRFQHVRERDGHWCKVPGCSRPAKQTHHLVFRSHGGSNAGWNLISVCAVHHLHGIHDGRMSVSGRAPDELVWKFGLRRSSAQTAVP